MKARYVFVTDSGNKNTPFDGLTYVYSEKSPLRETAKVNGTKLIKFREVLKDEITDTERCDFMERNKLSVIRRSSTGWFIENASGESSGVAYNSPRAAIDAAMSEEKKK